MTDTITKVAEAIEPWLPQPEFLDKNNIEIFERNRMNCSKAAANVILSSEEVTGLIEATQRLLANCADAVDGNYRKRMVIVENEYWEKLNLTLSAIQKLKSEVQK